MARGKRHGYIHTYQQNTDNIAPLAGEGLKIRENDKSNIRATQTEARNITIQKDDLNRIGHIYNYWFETYPDYKKDKVWKLSEEERASEDLFYHTNEHDIVYSGLNIDFVKDFLSSKQKIAIGVVIIFLCIS